MVCRCYVVIGCIDVALILHFALKNCISYWRLKDALPMDVLEVITSHMRVLKNDTQR